MYVTVLHTAWAYTMESVTYVIEHRPEQGSGQGQGGESSL